jgi:SAM-dependent methyltransferase
MTGRLSDSQALWDGHARRDPLWAILSDPAKKGGRWNTERFFHTGIAEISHILYYLRLRDVTTMRRRALDFGCGVGRLSQALARHFARVDGVDVSPAMIDLARSLNRYGDRVAYHANDRPDLSLFPDEAFDLVVSSIVLQHIEPSVATRYLRELCRVTGVGGAFVVQLPARQRVAEDPPLADEVDRRLSNLPDDAYRASLTVTGPPPAAARPRTSFTLDVEVVNTSAFEWSRAAFGIIRVGNHWLDESGFTMLVGDDGRTSLPEPLFPEDRCRVQLTITTPREEGDYWCEIDLAHEGVVWFRERGSRAVRFLVRVRTTPDASLAINELPEAAVVVETAAAPAAPDEPLALEPPADTANPREFPMYGIARDEVVALLHDASLEVVAVDDDRSCGEDWISYRYFARKSPRARSQSVTD